MRIAASVMLACAFMLSRQFVQPSLAHEGEDDASEYTTHVVKVHHQPAKTPAKSGSTGKVVVEQEPPTTEYRTHIEHIKPQVSTAATAPKPSASSPPSTSTAASAGSTQTTPDTAQTAASTPQPSRPAASATQPTDLDTIAVATVHDDASRSSILKSDLILENAPQLKQYDRVSIGAGEFRAFLHATHKGVYAGKNEIYVLKGKWDHAEHLLEQCGLAYSSGGTRGMLDKLDQAAVIVVDCPGDLDERSVPALRDYVRSGGCLISTDWALDNCVARVFPGYLVWKGAYSIPETVDAVPVLPGHPMLAGVNQVAPWRLADKCQIVELGGAGAVDVLVRSRGLMHDDPNKLGILAASFRYGKGKVLHLVGHFENNEGLSFAELLPDPDSSIKISMRQAIAINFIAEALEKAHAKRP